jgi:hypothetical protein
MNDDSSADSAIADALPHPIVLWALVVLLLVGLYAGWFK